MRKILIVITLMFLCQGCRDVVPVDSYNGLNGLKGENIEFVTRDSTLYSVKLKEVYKDSMVVAGYRGRDYHREPFTGGIPFSEVVYIQTGKDELLPAWVIIAGNAYFLVYGGVVFAEGSSAASEVIIPSTGGGSCPFVYSWNGKSYELEGETFGTALGKAMETETAVVLDALQSCEGKLKIKFTNERPETHFFNRIDLCGIKVTGNEKVYADSRNVFRTVSNPLKISRASNMKGQDITPALSQDDSLLWKSDLSTGCPAGDFEDIIYLKINPKENNDSLSLIVSAINTAISDVVFKYLVKELGVDYLEFISDAEKDPSVIKVLKDFLGRCALKAEIWDGNKWIPGDKLYPEANVAPFTRLLRLPVVKEGNGIMNIRLRALTGLWEINSIDYDESEMPLPELIKPELLSNDIRSRKIMSTDDEYLKLLPGEEYSLEYKLPDDGKQQKIIYAVTARGYLYEYILCTGTDNHLPETSSESPRVRILKKLLNEQDLLLSMIYNQYREEQKKL